MARIRLTRRWAKVARSGDCVYLSNIGIMPLILSNADEHLMPGGSAFHASLPADLSACAIRGVTELAVTVTSGLTMERPVTPSTSQRG